MRQNVAGEKKSLTNLYINDILVDVSDDKERHAMSLTQTEGEGNGKPNSNVSF